MHTLTRKLVLLLTVLMFLISASYAQPGALDPNFNSADVGFSFGDGPNFEVRAVAGQENGKFVIGGNFTSYNGTAASRLARLHTDGSLDLTFDTRQGANSTITSIAVQPDGKIIIGGTFTSYNGVARNGVARLNADGSLDSSFDPGTSLNRHVQTLMLQGDGKVLLAGSFFNNNYSVSSNLSRLNPDGTTDTGFSTQVRSGSGSGIRSIAIQEDGKIVIGGSFSFVNQVTSYSLVRLQADGSVDAEFAHGAGNSARTNVHAVKLQPDGKILVGGEISMYNGTEAYNVVRLNTNGGIDTGFSTGSGRGGAIQALAVQDDGRVLAAGSFVSFAGAANNIARLEPDGSLDGSFRQGLGTDKAITSLILQEERIVIGGDFGFYGGTSRNKVALLRLDGSLDGNFNAVTGANARVLATAVQRDGKVLIGGMFTSYNGANRYGLARLHPDGSLDAGFIPALGLSSTSPGSSVIYTVAVQGDGKILVGGDLFNSEGAGMGSLARLNPDGSMDEAFSPNGFYSSGGSVFVLPDGKILVPGNFASANGTSVRGVARLLPDGSLDESFSPQSGISGTIQAIAPEDNSAVYIAGSFGFAGSTPRHGVVRLLGDGSLDTDFDPNLKQNSAVSAIAIQADRKVIIAGSFTFKDSNEPATIARLNPDGSLDTGFNPGRGPSGRVHAIGIQENGHIVVGGTFSAYSGTQSRFLARLRPNGSLDSEFSTGAGPNGTVYSLALQNDEHILIGGLFTSYNNTGRNRVARVSGGRSSTTSIPDAEEVKKAVLIYPNPSSGQITIDPAVAQISAGKIRILNSQGKVLLEKDFKGQAITFDLGSYPKGIYLLQFASGKEAFTDKLIIQ
ncbi:T9SS type A sorting domain-containing protein [Pontibacter sp. 13R65]